MKAMLLAAGLGTRLRPLTEDRPKALTEIDGESLIARHVRRLVTAGVSDIVINLSYRGEKIREHLGTGQRHGAKIVYSDEGEQPLETGGGVLAALPLLGGEPFLLVNSDVVTDFDFAILEPGRRLGTLVLVPNPPHHPAGDFGLDAQSLLTDTEPRLTFSGISVLDPAVFAHSGSTSAQRLDSSKRALRCAPHTRNATPITRCSSGVASPPSGPSPCRGHPARL
jgi:MurNAc alpha-1-phosphate uridylyltransferase